jgi:hypothetical protein
MTDGNYTHYVLLVDRTGSMQAIRAETENGIRHYVAEQQKLPGRATLSLYQFDAWHKQNETGQPYGDMVTQVENVTDFTPVAEVPDYVLVPRGNTPLLDAFGYTVTETGEKLAALPEHQRPSKVYFTIATDGQENWSREWTKERVKALTEQQQRDYGWQFTYIGANQDAFAEARGMGIPLAAAMDYSATPGGTASAWASASSATVRSRKTDAPIAYTGAERKAAREEK